MLFVDKDKKRDYDVTYLFCASRLPKEGWLQCCFNCGKTSTSDSYEFLLDTKERSILGEKNKLSVYICHNCKTTIDTDSSLNEELENRISSYIGRMRCD